MRILSALFSVALCAAAASAAELNAVKAADVKALCIEVPAPAAPQQPALKCGHVTGEITKLHLLAQPAKSMLYTFPKTEAEFTEFVNMWTPILQKFGMKVTGTEFKADGLSTLKYESPTAAWCASSWARTSITTPRTRPRSGRSSTSCSSRSSAPA